jgi:hypothetical protein
MLDIRNFIDAGSAKIGRVFPYTCGKLVALNFDLLHGENSPPVEAGGPLIYSRARNGPGEGGETSLARL